MHLLAMLLEVSGLILHLGKIVLLLYGSAMVGPEHESAIQDEVCRSNIHMSNRKPSEVSPSSHGLGLRLIAPFVRRHEMSKRIFLAIIFFGVAGVFAANPVIVAKQTARGASSMNAKSWRSLRIC